MEPSQGRNASQHTSGPRRTTSAPSNNLLARTDSRTSASDPDHLIDAPRCYTWGHIESQRSIVSSAPWALENWNKPDPVLAPQDSRPLVYPRRLVSVRDLSVVELAGTQTLGPYVAVSHTWGRRTAEGDTTAGAAYRFGSEHAQKLEEIRAAVGRLGDRYFWIDTMCIDQDNELEKREEVKKMGHYYRNASRCLVHLDDLAASEMLSKSYPFFREYIERVPSGIDSMTHIMAGMSDERIFMSAMFLINSIVDSFWGTRVWTIQEALLNPILEFIIPGMPDVLSSRMIENALYLKTVSSALFKANSDGALRPGDFPPGFHTSIHMPLGEQIVNDGKNNIAQAILTRRKAVSDLSTALDLVRVRDCTLAEDRVYGILGLLPYGEHVKVDYSGGLRSATRELFDCALQHGDTSGMYFTGGSHGMIPDLASSRPSLVPRTAFPHARAGRGTDMVVEYVGAVRSSIVLRENIARAGGADKLRLTLQAAYAVVDLMAQGALAPAQAAYAVCLNLPGDREKVRVLAGRGACDSLEEQQAVRGMGVVYGDSRLVLARVGCAGRADRWVGVSSDEEDIAGCHVVCHGATSWGDRVGVVVRHVRASVMRRVGASGPIQKDVYPVISIQVPDDE